MKNEEWSYIWGVLPKLSVGVQDSSNQNGSSLRGQYSQAEKLVYFYLHLLFICIVSSRNMLTCGQVNCWLILGKKYYCLFLFIFFSGVKRFVHLRWSRQWSGYL